VIQIQESLDKISTIELVLLGIRAVLQKAIIEGVCAEDV